MSLTTIQIPAGLSTHVFVLGEGVLAQLPELLTQYFPGKTPCIIADDNTWSAAGAKGAQILTEAGIATLPPCIFPATPMLHPNYKYSQELAEKLPQNCVPVAIGSGVINDITKCASGLLNIHYCCVPTACSVDGYTSSGGAMTVNGTKKTVKCPPPFAICADTHVLQTAPAPMFASGYADLLTKIPAGADWLIADTLGEEPIRQDVWDYIQGNIRRWVTDCHDMPAVFEGLAATGYAMQMYQESRPASGAEHLFSHVWEMEDLKLNGTEVSHGFKVGVGLIGSTFLHEFIINNDIRTLIDKMSPVLSVEQRQAEIQALLKRNCYGDAPAITAMKKFRADEAGKQQREKIINAWPVLQEKLKGQIYPLAKMRQLLIDAHCPTAPEQIGLSMEQFIHGIKTAQLIRIRYTVIDLLYETGLLNYALELLKDALMKI